MPPSQLSPEDYAELVEQAPILIWRAGEDSLCDYFNARWFAFTGRCLPMLMRHLQEEVAYLNGLPPSSEAQSQAITKTLANLAEQAGKAKTVYDQAEQLYNSLKPAGDLLKTRAAKPI